MTGVVILTLRELATRKILIGLFVVATLIWILLASALRLDVVEGTLEGIRIFGQAAENMDDHSGEPVAFPADALQQFVFAAEAAVAGAAYWVGILLGLFATGGLITSMMERGQVDLLVSKPLGRSRILAGRLVAIAVVIAVLAAYLLGMVWLVMSLKTGVWNPRFLLVIPVVFAMFVVMYGIVTFVSVWTDSSPLALIVALGVIFASLVLAIPGLPDRIRPPWRQVYVGAGDLLPDFPVVGVSIVPKLATGSVVGSWWPLATSMLFGLVLYAGAFWLFRRKDF